MGPKFENAEKKGKRKRNLYHSTQSLHFII